MPSEGFNVMAYEFIKELAQVFPENTHLTSCADAYDSLVASDPEAPMAFFLSTLGKRTDLVLARDEAVLDVVSVPGMDVRAMWSSVSDTTKDAIWQYLRMLAMLAVTTEQTSTDLMSGIEDMAKELAEKMAAGKMDVDSMMTEVLSRVQQMDLSSLEHVDVGALTRSLGVDPSQISQMVGGMMGGLDPKMISTVTSLMHNEKDLLQLLETARPKKRKSNKKKK